MSKCVNTYVYISNSQGPIEILRYIVEEPFYMKGRFFAKRIEKYNNDELESDYCSKNFEELNSKIRLSELKYLS